MFQLFVTGFKKQLIALTEIVSVGSTCRIKITVSLTSATTDFKIRAFPTFLCQIQGAIYEANFFPSFVHFFQAVLIKISKSICIQHIKVARIDTSVCLHHILDTANTTLIAGLRLTSQKNSDIVFKLPDVWLLSLSQSAYQS